MNTPSSLKKAFDLAASTYDQARRQLIPCFDDFYGTALRLMPFAPQDQFRVLDLGAGTGLLSQMVADKYPRAAITLMDISDEMLDKARQRFAGREGRFKFVVSDYSQVLSGQFDVIVSALSIHHLTDGQKAGLFRNLFALLPVGGVFINADQVLGSSPAIEQAYRQTWLQQVGDSGVSAEELAAALERMKEDRMAPLQAQMDWLQEAGFGVVHCWYKNFSFVVYSGIRMP